jgi:hypothetical protein
MRFELVLLGCLTAFAVATPVAEPESLEKRVTSLPILINTNNQDDSGGRVVAQALIPAKEFNVTDCPTCSKATSKSEFQLFANSIGVGLATGVGSASAFLGNAPATAKWAVIDYAIHSDEFATGWVGTQFNDYFEVSMTCGPKSTPPPPFVVASGSIGQVSFDPQGTTNCYKLSINLQGLKGVKNCVAGVSVADAIDKILHTSICAKAYYL